MLPAGLTLQSNDGGVNVVVIMPNGTSKLFGPLIAARPIKLKHKHCQK